MKNCYNTLLHQTINKSLKLSDRQIQTLHKIIYLYCCVRKVPLLSQILVRESPEPPITFFVKRTSHQKYQGTFFQGHFVLYTFFTKIILFQVRLMYKRVPRNKPALMEHLDDPIIEYIQLYRLDQVLIHKGSFTKGDETGTYLRSKQHSNFHVHVTFTSGWPDGCWNMFQFS